MGNFWFADDETSEKLSRLDRELSKIEARDPVEVRESCYCALRGYLVLVAVIAVAVYVFSALR